MDYSNISATSFIPNYTDSNNSFNYNQSSNNTFQSSPSPSSPPYPNYFCWNYYGTDQLITIIIISIWSILTPLAIYSLYSQVRSDHVVPVFIINLIISDIIQICSMIVQVADVKGLVKFVFTQIVYTCGVLASVSFMIFIAMERYLLIAWPFWYRFQRKLKVSASVSVVSWILSGIIGFNEGPWVGSFLILPLPLLIFFFVRSLKGLSASHNVPPDERRQIIAVLTVVLFAYMLTFLPRIITDFVSWCFNYTTYINFTNVSCTLIQLNPLTDLLLYIIMKKWLFDKLLAFLCCCRKTNNVNQQANSMTETTSSWSASQGQEEAENHS